MEFFKREKKVHLSPRLARSIGKNNKPALHRILELSVVAGLLLILTLVFGSKNGTAKLPTSATQAQEQLNGEVLGAETDGIIDYTVKPGDTLISISGTFGVFWTTIVEENELSSPYTLHPGQVLRIPLPRNP